jgi:hypothetical protein
MIIAFAKNLCPANPILAAPRYAPSIARRFADIFIL